MTFVQIYTDSSFCPKTKKAAYSLAIQSLFYRGTRYVTQLINSRVSNPTLAELIAITEGLYKARRLHRNMFISGFEVITDSRGAQKMVADGYHRNFEVMQQLQRIRAIEDMGFVVKVFWTRAHTNDKDKHSTMNAKVDKLAKTELRKHLKQLNTTE